MEIRHYYEGSRRRMPRPSSEVRTVGQAIEHGLDQAAAWLGNPNIHATEREMADQLQRWFPNLRGQSLQAAIRFSVATYEAAQPLNMGIVAARDTATPRIPNQPTDTPYRYYLKITLTPTEESQTTDTEPIVKYMTFNAAQRYAAQDLQRRLRGQIMQSFRRGVERRGAISELPEDTGTYLFSVEIMGIQRKG